MHHLNKLLLKKINSLVKKTLTRKELCKYCMFEFTKIYIHPSLKASATLNTSASFKNAELIRIGNGYFSNNLGNFTTASHCTPSLIDRKPMK